MNFHMRSRRFTPGIQPATKHEEKKSYLRLRRQQLEPLRKPKVSSKIALRMKTQQCAEKPLR